ncbi:hypothetical protein [Nitrobacter winogradskyi]|uniref:hypothetical protein n=1 Tax=Nitrobacter winogradskyi TaxID=913 RepID=UPI001AEDB04F|nr:hypothetical protein [Nitrobacter winogradskyi]
MKEKHTLRMREAGILIGCPSLARHSIRGEGLIHQMRRSDIVTPAIAAVEATDPQNAPERDAPVGV